MCYEQALGIDAQSSVGGTVTRSFVICTGIRCVFCSGVVVSFLPPRDDPGTLVKAGVTATVKSCSKARFNLHILRKGLIAVAI